MYAPPAVETQVETNSGVGAPWERRNELGFFKALWLTWKESMFSPQEFWKSLRPDGEWTTALTYAWVMNVIGTVLGLPMLVFQWSDANFERLTANSEPLRNLLEGVPVSALLAGYVMGALILFPLGFIIFGAITHVCAILTGASKNGWNATLRVIGYSYSASPLAAIPCVGILSAIYMYVLMGLGIKQLQQTTAGRAVVAVILPIVFLCCCFAAILGFGVAMSANSLK